MTFEAAWKVVSLALALLGCIAAWGACALSGGDLLECVIKGVIFFAVLWIVFCLLGALLRVFMLSGKQDEENPNG